MPLTDECRTCEYSKRCNRSDRARGMRCKDYQLAKNLLRNKKENKNNEQSRNI